MRPIATDGVSSSVGLSVGHDREPCKTAEPIEILLGRELGWAQATMYEMGVPIPQGKGQFWGRNGVDPGHARACPTVDILKATQQGAEPVLCGCRLGCMY